jgi:hypothetical protein
MASHDQHHDINICDAGRLGDEEHTGVEFKVLYTWPPTINIISSRFMAPEGSAIMNKWEFKVLYTWPPMNNLILMKNQTQEGLTIATLAH